MRQQIRSLPMKKMLMLFLLWCLPVSLVAQQPMVVDEIVAVVDDNIILKSELQQLAINLAVRAKIEPKEGNPQFEELLRNTLEQLVIQKVLLVKAKEDSVTIEQTRVDRVLDEQMAAMISHFGSEAAVEEYFGSTMRKVKRNIRKDIEERLLVETLQQRKVFQINISRREVNEFYRTMQDSLPERPAMVKISHILKAVKGSDESRRKALEKILEAKRILSQGVDFAEVARQYSEDPSGARGGNLGSMRRSDLVKEYADAAAALNVGEISDVVETQFGFHLIQLMGRAGDEIDTRHILVRVPITPEDEQKTIAFLDSVRREITAGDLTFAEAARQISEDESTREKGGQLGTFPQDQIQLPAWRDAAQRLEPGETSEPIKTDFGFILVRVDEREPARTLTLKDDWEDIERLALSFKREQQFINWVEDLKKNVYIKIKPQYQSS